MITLYGIKNCDTVKKARKWLEQKRIDYQFHDFREDGISAKQVKQWIAELGWEGLINKRSTSWKTLGESQKVILDDHNAVELILATPTLIKRPLLDTGTAIYLGFDAADFLLLMVALMLSFTISVDIISTSTGCVCTEEEAELLVAVFIFTPSL